MQKTNRLLLAIVLILGFSLFTSTQISAASCSWDGSSDNTWSDPSNWSAGCSGPGGIPGDTDDLTFPGGASNTDMENDIVGLDLNSMTFQSEFGYTLTGNGLGIASTISEDPGDFGFSSTALDVDITLTDDVRFLSTMSLVVTGDVDLNGNELSMEMPSGQVRIQGDISGNGGLLGDGGTFFLSGNNTFVGDIILEDNTSVSLGSITGAGNANNVISSSAVNSAVDVSGTVGTIPNDITFTGGNNYISSSGNNTLSGDITIGSTIQISSDVSSSFNLTLSGVISGSGALTKTGTGRVTLAGASANTFSGQFNINEGEVVLNKTGSVNALSSTSISIGDAGGGDSSVVLLHSGSTAQIPTSANVTVNSDGNWDLNDKDLTVTSVTVNGGLVELQGAQLIVSDLTMEGGLITTGVSGNLVLITNFDATSTADETSEVTGTLSLAAAQVVQVEVTDGPQATDLLISAEITGPVSIYNFQIAGDGNVAFGGDNTYARPTIVTGSAKLALLTSVALGDAGDGTTLEGNSRLIVGGGLNINESFVLNSSNPSAIMASGGNIFHGTIALGRNTTVTSDSGGIIDFNGVISGSYRLTLECLSGDANVTINETNSFSELYIGNGIAVIVDDNDNIASASAIIAADGLLVAAPTGVNVAGINGSGTVTLGTGVLEIEAADYKTFYGTITGAGRLAITNMGGHYQSFAEESEGLGIYEIELNSGKTIINGNFPAADVVLNGGGVGGNGTVGSISSESGGVVEPGNSPGTLNVVGDMVLNSANTITVELDGTAAGTEYDEIIVGGNANLGDATLVIAPGFTPAVGTQFTIISATGGLTGTFTGVANHATVSVGGARYRVDYNSNTVVLTYLGSTLASTGIQLPVVPLAGVLLVAGLTLFRPEEHRHRIERE
jgi:fibronectin-binding autotransporter adhesin